MNGKSKSLDTFKKKCGYMQDDSTCIIQSGVYGNTKYLINLLKTKCVGEAKLVISSMQSIIMIMNYNYRYTIKRKNTSIKGI